MNDILVFHTLRLVFHNFSVKLNTVFSTIECSVLGLMYSHVDQDLKTFICQSILPFSQQLSYC